MISELLLPKLAEWQPTGAGRHSWSNYLDEQGWNVFLTVEKVDTLGSLIWDLSVARITAIESTADDLKTVAARIAKNATGLIEPLTVIEIDSTRMEAILRSNSPSTKGEKVFYYEVKLFGRNRAEVRRFQTVPVSTNRREQVAFALTHEAIAKLFGDLIG